MMGEGPESPGRHGPTPVIRGLTKGRGEEGKYLVCNLVQVED